MNNFAKHDHVYDLYAGCAVEYANVTDPKGMKYPHYHDDYEFYFLITGNRKYFLPNKIYNVNPNNIMIIKPNDRHQVTINLNVPYSRYVLYVSPPLLNSILRENPSLHNCAMSQAFFLSEDDFSRVLNIISKLSMEFKKRDVFSPNFIKTLLSELLLEVSRNNRPDLCVFHENDLQIQASIYYLMENYMKPITIKDCADIAGFSVSHFSRLFRKTTASNFKEYLNKIRIDKSCELLLIPKKKISEIAQEVGFTTESYYIKVFKTFKNISPSSYRKNFTN